MQRKSVLPKIYFAGSIRGGREDAELYTRLICHLQNYGRVLTEHVGDGVLLAEEQAMSDHEIFERDMAWLAEADVLVAEVSTPSLGVGFEIAAALNLGKTVCCLSRVPPGKPLSAMISGNRELVVFSYATETEAKACLDKFIEKLCDGGNTRGFQSL